MQKKAVVVKGRKEGRKEEREKPFFLSKSIWIYDIGCNTTWTQTRDRPFPLNHLKPVTLPRKHVRSASFIYFHILYFPLSATISLPSPLRVDLSE